MKKPLKVAGWSGILLIAVAVVLWIVQYTVGMNMTFNLSMSIINMALTVLFLNGFLVLGKRFKSTMLIVMTWIGIAFAVGFTIIGFVTSVNAQGLASDSATKLGLIVIYVFISVIFGAYSILFGVGLLKIGDKVEKARTAGIIEIVAGASMIIVVGWFVKLAAFIFEIVLLQKASKKFEK